MVTKTIGQLHFEDLDPIRFEELILSIVYRMRRWEKLDHFGKKGSDDGIDIRAVELLENGKRDTYHIQCKRYSKLTATQIRGIIKNYTDKNKDIPDFYILAMACPLTKKQIEIFEKCCTENGFKSYTVWTGSVIEAMLYGSYQDLLFAYFGINMIEKKNQTAGSIRRNIALKKRMRSDFIQYPVMKTSADHMKVAREPWTKFKYSEVIIRSIYDKAYPEDNTLLNNDGTGYYKAEVYDFYHNGLLARAFPYDQDIIVKVEDYNGNVREKKVRVETLGCIPFENIIEYDFDGDEYYPFSHVFCDFVNLTDPYEKIRYIDPDSGSAYSDDEIASLTVEQQWL